MIKTIKEGDFVIYTSQKGYDDFNTICDKMWEEIYFKSVLESINWRENKKYFINDKKEEKDSRTKC